MAEKNLDERLKAYEDYHRSFGRDIRGHRKAVRAFFAFEANKPEPKGAAKKAEPKKEKKADKPKEEKGEDK